VVGCAFELQHLVYRAIELGLAESAEGESIEIVLEPGEGGGARITVTAGASSGASADASPGASSGAGARHDDATDTAAEAAAREAFLVTFATQLGGHARLVRNGGRPLAISLELPAELRRASAGAAPPPGAAPHEGHDDRGGRDR
jgi:hypothetical protein